MVILNPALFIVVATVGFTQGSHMCRHSGSFLKHCMVTVMMTLMEMVMMMMFYIGSF